MRRLTAWIARPVYSIGVTRKESRTIKKDKAFDDCVILSKESFDPDAVFMEDIVDDEVLPYLSLAVDGLTGGKDGRKGKLDLRPDDVPANDPQPDTTMPVTALEPDAIEVYGWETSLWKKIKSYFSF